MAISKVYLNSDVQMDVTDTTASQSDVASTKYYYGADGVKKQGSYVVPSAVTQATPTISVNTSTGLITASATQSAGVVSAGTKSATEQLSTENGKTVTPTTSEQTAVAANKYTLGAIKVAAMPVGSAGTPTATKGTVSNHSVSVTPSVTNTTGYITGSTKTGTAVSVSASELVSGTKSISTNGTNIDVTNYASVDVSVPTGTARDGDDVSVSGATVTVPAGLYSSQVSKTVASGSAATPATSITANPSISVSSGGLITATASATKSVTPTVSAGYVSSGSAGTITVSGSNTEQLSTQAAQTLYPSTTDQTISSGKYLTGTQTVKGVLLTNLDAGNIKKDVVVKVGDSADDDRITSVTGTYEGSGGGVTPAPEKDVNFIDYDGTIVYSYTKAEFANLSALPANPSHTGLTAQGWNWSLSDAKTYVAANGKLWIGQMYITASGDTEIDVWFPDKNRLSPVLIIAVNGTVTVDWGDGTSANTATGSSLTTRQQVPHTYASTGHYTIVIHVVSGSFTFRGSANYTVLRKGTVGDESRVYANCVQAVRFGSGIASIGSYAFYYCSSLASVTISSDVASIGNYAFSDCYSLASVTIPSDVTSIGSYTFSYCYGLAHVAMPSGVTSFNNNAFYYCYGLASITVPSGVTSVNAYAFQNCYSLGSITMPSEATSIGAYAFQSCYGLASITVPSGVTSIGASAFQYCYGFGKLRFEPTTPPVVDNSNAFFYLPTDCIISVPTGKLTDYTTASNYPSSSTYTYVEE